MITAACLWGRFFFFGRWGWGKFGFTEAVAFGAEGLAGGTFGALCIVGAGEAAGGFSFAIDLPRDALGACVAIAQTLAGNAEGAGANAEGIFAHGALGTIGVGGAGRAIYALAFFAIVIGGAIGVGLAGGVGDTKAVARGCIAGEAMRADDVLLTGNAAIGSAIVGEAGERGGAGGGGFAGIPELVIGLAVAITARGCGGTVDVIFATFGVDTSAFFAFLVCGAFFVFGATCVALGFFLGILEEAIAGLIDADEIGAACGEDFEAAIGFTDAEVIGMTAFGKLDLGFIITVGGFSVFKAHIITATVDDDLDLLGGLAASVIIIRVKIRIFGAFYKLGEMNGGMDEGSFEVDTDEILRPIVFVDLAVSDAKLCPRAGEDIFSVAVAIEPADGDAFSGGVTVGDIFAGGRAATELTFDAVGGGRSILSVVAKVIIHIHILAV